VGCHVIREEVDLDHQQLEQAELINPDLKGWEAGWSCHEICGYQQLGKQITMNSALSNVCQLVFKAVHVLLALLQWQQSRSFIQHPDMYIDELQWYLAVHFDIKISISFPSGETHKSWAYKEGFA
jgi:hypothetical protein